MQVVELLARIEVAVEVGIVSDAVLHAIGRTDKLTAETAGADCVGHLVSPRSDSLGG